VDVGANIGIYTALLAGLVGPGGVVHAIEPSPPALRRLRELERLSQVTIHACAVGETPGSGHLAVGPGDSMHSTLRPGVAGERLEVRVMPLTDLVGATPVTFVKVDVEGYEEAVLAGMRLLLERHQVGAVMLEVEPDYGPPRWITELQHIPGYTLYAVAGKRRAGRVVACLRQDAPDRGTVLLVRNNGAPAVPVGR
jgi:FkbM family methyltransferase